VPAGAWITIAVLAGSLTIALALLGIAVVRLRERGVGRMLMSPIDDLSRWATELRGVPGEHALWRVGRRRG
jgi:hypothetical protein